MTVTSKENSVQTQCLTRRLMLVLLFLLVWAFIAACSSTNQSTPLSPVEVEQTVQASVEERLTAIAPTPDIEATVNFRLTAIASDSTSISTAVPSDTSFTTDSPNPAPNEQLTLFDHLANIVAAIISILPSVFSFFVNLWNTVGQFGTIAQITCCGLPALIGGGTIITIKFR